MMILRRMGWTAATVLASVAMVTGGSVNARAAQQPPAKQGKTPAKKAATNVTAPKTLVVVTADGFRVKVVEASRVGRKWKGHVFFTFTAPEGSEIVVLKVNIARTGEKETFEAETAELTLADGTTSISPVKSISNSFPQKDSIDTDVPFIVLTGAKLKSVKLGSLTLDVSHLPVKDSTGKSDP